MKTIRNLFVLAVFFCAALSTAAQGRYTPLTTWPYLYEDFSPGRITTWKGAVVNYDNLNINIITGRAHYIQDGTIMEADPLTVALLYIGEDSFVRAEGRMMKVLKNTEHSAVVLSVTVDTDAMNRASIGYGTSAIASTQHVSTAAISGDMAYSINRSLDTMVQDRYSGERLTLKEVKGLLYKGVFVPASRSDVLKIPGIDKNAVKQFIKTEKIRFSDTESLGRLADFLYTL